MGYNQKSINMILKNINKARIFMLSTLSYKNEKYIKIKNIMMTMHMNFINIILRK